MTRFLGPVRGLALILALVLGLLAGGVATAAPVGSSTFEGLVQHVSTDNIKVYDPKTKQTESFLLVPKFDQVFSSDGKTTYQMSKLHNGQYVKVYYDQKALGARHADRILVLNNANQKVGQQ